MVTFHGAGNRRSVACFSELYNILTNQDGTPKERQSVHEVFAATKPYRFFLDIEPPKGSIERPDIEAIC